jgi:hypothetical protein
MFNWLTKRIPYSLSIILLTLLWTILSAGICGGSIVLNRAEFHITGTGKLFVITLISVVIFFASLAILEQVSILKFKGRDWKTLNDNVKNGSIISGVSDKNLLKIHRVLENMNQWMLQRNIQYTAASLSIIILVEWFTTYHIKNVVVIFIGGGLAIFWSNIGVLFFHQLITMPVRRQCRILLAKRNISFNEASPYSLKTRSRQFTSLLIVLVVGILMLVPSLNLNVIIFSTIVLIIIIILNEALFRTIYYAFSDFKEASKRLSLGQEKILFSGSLDQEAIDLFKSLRATAKEIQASKEALEQAKSILEIRVTSRTKELEELADSLDLKVKEKTKELEQKIKELEKFQKFAVDREIKMVELKSEIKKLKKINNKNNKQA